MYCIRNTCKAHQEPGTAHTVDSNASSYPYIKQGLHAAAQQRDVVVSKSAPRHPSAHCGYHCTHIHTGVHTHWLNSTRGPWQREPGAVRHHHSHQLPPSTSGHPDRQTQDTFNQPGPRQLQPEAKPDYARHSCTITRCSHPQPAHGCAAGPIVLARSALHSVARLLLIPWAAEHSMCIQLLQSVAGLHSHSSLLRLCVSGSGWKHAVILNITS